VDEINARRTEAATLSESTRADWPSFSVGRSRLVRADCIEWLEAAPTHSIHAVVTDPPYGLVEYSAEEQEKLRRGRGGVWRIPPSFDGHLRSPLPRFTVLSEADHERLVAFFRAWGRALLPALVPGAHVIMACNPLISHLVCWAMTREGYEKRGEVIRLVMTMRGGDRPKNAHEEFSGVSVMPRSMWEPWVLFRKPLEGRAQDNLRKWRVGGLRRPSRDVPFGDVIKSSPAPKAERLLAPHPSLKPQRFLRAVARAMLPFGEGVILDPFAGSGSTLAAAEAVGYSSVGVERDPKYFELARGAVPQLSRLYPGEVGEPPGETI
jgi:site-specific DNA-methyltransferase (adenine-specific)